MGRFDYKRPGDEQMLEGGGSGGGYSSKNKVFNDAGDVAAAFGTGLMGLLGVKKALHDSNEADKLGADPRNVDVEYSHEGRNATKAKAKAEGGSIKKMASGGMTSKASGASKRADGIAQRGKTRGRIC